MFTRVLNRIVWRVAVSAVGGLLVTILATAALAFGTAASADRLAVGRTLSESLAPALTAVAGAGFLATIVLFACFAANDVARTAGPWLVARRSLLLGPLRAITLSVARAIAWSVARIALAIVVALQFVVRSTVAVEAVWLVRTVGWPVVLVSGYGVVVGLCAIVYVGFIVTGVGCIGWSTHVLVTMLDDPPRPLAMALGFGGAAALMYIGISAFALCAWVTYQATRAGVRLAVRRVGSATS